MSTQTYAMIEILMFFGGVFAFAVWQLRSVRRSIAADKAARERGEDPAEIARGSNQPPSKEDIFWREMTRPKKKT